MAVLADDDVVVNRYAERLCRIDDHLRHVDIGARRRRVARGMVVDQDQRGCRKLQRALDHFTRIDRRVIDRAAPLHLVGDQRVAFVEEENANMFLDLKNRNPFK
jgi:hypothetical protein